MSKVGDWTFEAIIPAEGWFANYGWDEDRLYHRKTAPLVCWALIQVLCTTIATDGCNTYQKRMVGMVLKGKEIVPADSQSNFEGYSRA